MQHYGVDPASMFLVSLIITVVLALVLTAFAGIAFGVRNLIKRCKPKHKFAGQRPLLDFRLGPGLVSAHCAALTPPCTCCCLLVRRLRVLPDLLQLLRHAVAALQRLLLRTAHRQLLRGRLVASVFG